MEDGSTKTVLRVAKYGPDGLVVPYFAKSDVHRPSHRKCKPAYIVKRFFKLKLAQSRARNVSCLFSWSLVYPSTRCLQYSATKH